MFKDKLDPNPGLQDAIDFLHLEMKACDPDTDKYAKMMVQLTELYKIKVSLKPDRVSKDTLALVGAQLIGIFAILHHESVNVITSKALSFVIKPK